VSSEIINLRQARKQKARAGKEAQAKENRKLYGRTKQEKARDLQEKTRAQNLLDQKKIDKESD